MLISANYLADSKTVKFGFFRSQGLSLKSGIWEDYFAQGKFFGSKTHFATGKISLDLSPIL